MTDDKQADNMHQFWDKQPIMKENRNIPLGYIDETLPTKVPSSEPGKLPEGFTWYEIDIENDEQLDEVYNFLALHYVEDMKHNLRFKYSKEIIKWTLCIPGYRREWILGVKSPNGILVGFISGTPCYIKLGGEVLDWSSVNLLCVHTKLRSKNMASALIAELCRRIRSMGIHRAVFSGDRVPSKPFSKCGFVQRPISIKKLHACDYYPIPPHMVSSYSSKFSIPRLEHSNTRLMTESDVPNVRKLLNDTDKFKFSIQFDDDLVRHMFLPIKDNLYTYVIPGSSDSIQAFFSFYMIDWSVLSENSMNIELIKAAYCFYCASYIDMKGVITDLVNKAGNDAKADIIMSVVISDMDSAFSANKFEKGVRELELYTYNYNIEFLESKDVRFLFI